MTASEDASPVTARSVLIFACRAGGILADRETHCCGMQTVVPFTCSPSLRFVFGSVNTFSTAPCSWFSRPWATAALMTCNS